MNTSATPLKVFLLLLAISIVGMVLLQMPTGLALRHEPFHDAATAGNWPAMKKLLDDGLPINAEDQNGDTPLYWALSKGQFQFADKLMKHGANLNHGGTGYTVRDKLAYIADKRLKLWLEKNP